jgi:hypothetical protein
MPKGWLLAALIACSPIAAAQLSPAERQGISDALYIGNMSATDLDADRSSSRNQIVRDSINHPLDSVGTIAGLRQIAAKRDLAQILDYLRKEGYSDPGAVPEPVADIPVPDDIPERLRPSIKRLLGQLQVANNLIKKATEKLTAEEKRMLIEALPRYATGVSEVKFEFVKQPLPERKLVDELISKVDFALLRAAASGLAQVIQTEIPKLKDVSGSLEIPGSIKLTIEGMAIEISGRGNDVHDSTNAVLCIDLGGSDRYTGRYGAGVGYASILIDLGGDDSYDVPDLSIGAGVLGIGLAFDLGGNDIFRSDSISFGSGIAGIGALVKDGGSSFFHSRALAQGFGMEGIGILLSGSGNDTYSVGAYGQGSARDNGIGWLIDKSGDDTYRSLPLIPDPRMKGPFLGASQGFGAGPGALGLVTDQGGADLYSSDTKSQGFAMQGGVGVLDDSAGADIYSASYQAQGCGFSSGEGMLLDQVGDDSYTLRLGSGHAFGHDHGIGFLYDGAGDDLYAGLDSRPGNATANGLGIFLDSSGDDKYAGPPGTASPARGAGSIAVFADLGGTDSYSDGLSDGRAKSEPLTGVALDQAGALIGTDQGSDPPKPGSKPLPEEPKLEELFNSARNDDPSALDELINFGEPAVEWLVQKKLTAADATTISIVAWVSRQVGGNGEAAVVKSIQSKDDAAARASLLVAAEAGFVSAKPQLAQAFKRPLLVPAAIRAAGALSASESVQTLLILSTGAEKTIARNATVSLSQIGDEQSYGLMESLLSNSDMVIRDAAIALVSKFPERAKATAEALIAGSSEREARTGVIILSKLVGPDSRMSLGKALSDPRRGVKIQALIALDGNCPKEFRGQMIELRQSGDPLVKAVALQVDIGR